MVIDRSTNQDCNPKDAQLALALYWQESGDTVYHDRGVRIQYVAICCDTVSKIIYCFIGPCSVFTLASLLLPVSDVTLEWKSRKAEDRLQHSS